MMFETMMMLANFATKLIVTARVFFIGSRAPMMMKVTA